MVSLRFEKDREECCELIEAIDLKRSTTPNVKKGKTKPTTFGHLAIVYLIYPVFNVDSSKCFQGCVVLSEVPLVGLSDMA